MNHRVSGQVKGVNRLVRDLPHLIRTTRLSIRILVRADDTDRANDSAGVVGIRKKILLNWKPIDLGMVLQDSCIVESRPMHPLDMSLLLKYILQRECSRLSHQDEAAHWVLISPVSPVNSSRAAVALRTDNALTHRILSAEMAFHRWKVRLKRLLGELKRRSLLKEAL